MSKLWKYFLEIHFMLCLLLLWYLDTCKSSSAYRFPSFSPTRTMINAGSDWNILINDTTWRKKLPKHTFFIGMRLQGIIQIISVKEAYQILIDLYVLNEYSASQWSHLSPWPWRMIVSTVWTRTSSGVYYFFHHSNRKMAKLTRRKHLRTAKIIIKLVN